MAAHVVALAVLLALPPTLGQILDADDQFYAAAPPNEAGIPKINFQNNVNPSYGYPYPVNDTGSSYNQFGNSNGATPPSFPGLADTGNSYYTTARYGYRYPDNTTISPYTYYVYGNSSEAALPKYQGPVGFGDNSGATLPSYPNPAGFGNSYNRTNSHGFYYPGNTTISPFTYYGNSSGATPPRYPGPVGVGNSSGVTPPSFPYPISFPNSGGAPPPSYAGFGNSCYITVRYDYHYPGNITGSPYTYYGNRSGITPPSYPSPVGLGGSYTATNTYGFHYPGKMTISPLTYYGNSSGATPPRYPGSVGFGNNSGATPPNYPSPVGFGNSYNATNSYGVRYPGNTTESAYSYYGNYGITTPRSPSQAGFGSYYNTTASYGYRNPVSSTWAPYSDYSNSIFLTTRYPGSVNYASYYVATTPSSIRCPPERPERLSFAYTIQPFAEIVGLAIGAMAYVVPNPSIEDCLMVCKVDLPGCEVASFNMAEMTCSFYSANSKLSFAYNPLYQRGSVRRENYRWMVNVQNGGDYLYDVDDVLVANSFTDKLTDITMACANLCANLCAIHPECNAGVISPDKKCWLINKKFLNAAGVQVEALAFVSESLF